MILRLEQFAEVIEDSSARRAWWTEILASESEPEEVEIPRDFRVELSLN